MANTSQRNAPSETELKCIKNIFRSLLKKTGQSDNNQLNKAQEALKGKLNIVGTNRLNQLSRFPQPPNPSSN